MGPRSTDLPSQIQKFMTGLKFNTEDFQTGKTKVQSETIFVVLQITIGI